MGANDHEVAGRKRVGASPGKIERRGGATATLLLGLPGLLRAAEAADPVLVGAGDIASCSEDADEVTARMIDGGVTTPAPPLPPLGCAIAVTSAG